MFLLTFREEPGFYRENKNAQNFLFWTFFLFYNVIKLPHYDYLDSEELLRR